MTSAIKNRRNLSEAAEKPQTSKRAFDGGFQTFNITELELPEQVVDHRITI
jgi:hypothetical protein